MTPIRRRCSTSASLPGSASMSAGALRRAVAAPARRHSGWRAPAQLATAIRAVLGAIGRRVVAARLAGNGELGYFQHGWAVYGRRANLLRLQLRRGVRRIVQSGRSTFLRHAAADRGAGPIGSSGRGRMRRANPPATPLSRFSAASRIARPSSPRHSASLANRRARSRVVLAASASRATLSGVTNLANSFLPYQTLLSTGHRSHRPHAASTRAGENSPDHLIW
jgi:hypothetical protein